jgi:hypothetical protein
MCLASSPSMPAPPKPAQSVKQPDISQTMGKAQANRAAMAGGSLLTGPQGVTTPVATAKSSLLGQ